MIFGAIIVLVLASLLHAWHSSNAAAPLADRAVGFYAFGFLVNGLSAVLFLAGIALLWIGVGFVAALVGVIVYFLVLPLLSVLFLTALNLIPRRARH